MMTTTTMIQLTTRSSQIPFCRYGLGWRAACSLLEGSVF